MANLITAPNDPSNAAWAATIGTGSVTIDQAADPVGGHTAWRLQDNDAGAVYAVGQTVTIAVSALAYVAAVFIRKGAGSGKGISIDLRYGTPATPSAKAGIVVNDVTGTAVARTGWAPSAFDVIDYDDDFWLAYVSLPSDGSTALSIFVAPAFNSDLTGAAAVATKGSAVFYSATLEQGAIPSASLDCTWDESHKGADVSAINSGLTAIITAYQEWIRATLGRDPADGGEYQWEITVPVTTGGQNYQRPSFGMVDEDRIPASTAGSDFGYNNAHGWNYGFGAAGLENDFSYHAGTVSTNWSAGSHGGQPHTLSFLWRASDGRLKIHIDGALVYTATGVTSGAGKLMFPAFGTGSNYGPGLQIDQGVANFGATPFLYDLGGSPWGVIAEDVGIAFPSSLPRPLADGYSLKSMPVTLRTEMEGGVARVRRRFESSLTTATLCWNFTRAQFAVFDGWWRSTLLDGSSWFTIQLRNGVADEVWTARGMGEPSEDTSMPDVWRVSWQIEIEAIARMSADDIAALEA